MTYNALPPTLAKDELAECSYFSTAEGGKGWALTGDHEILIPPLATPLTEASQSGK
ncbi:MAG TPA: hypothetical protein VKI65_06225 [Gemmataceae bacterium]|nr:hypothetical protein [Gemmataceae bacterium]